jgi:hypothetical protein
VAQAAQGGGRVEHVVGAPAGVQGFEQPQLAQRVVVLVEGASAEAHGNAHTGRDHGAHRGDPRLEMEVRRGVDRDPHAMRGEHLQFVGPWPGRMRHGQPGREQADVGEMAHHALRMGPVGPVALVASLQQVHVHEPPGFGRAVRYAFEQRLAAPVHGSRAKLHIHHRAMHGLRHRLDQGDLRRWIGRGPEKRPLDEHAGLGLGGADGI